MNQKVHPLLRSTYRSLCKYNSYSSYISPIQNVTTTTTTTTTTQRAAIFHILHEGPDNSEFISATGTTVTDVSVTTPTCSYVQMTSMPCNPAGFTYVEDSI